MSTVGKVLVVAQVAFSILLMAFAAGVSSVQTNWKQKFDTATKSLTKATQDVSTLQDRVRTMETASKGLEKTLKDAADKARGEATASQEKVKQVQTQLAQTRTELENMRAEAKIGGDEARARRDEAVAFRDINAQLHENRDKLITTNRQQADKIVNLEQDAKSLNEKHLQVLNDKAILEKFIRIKGFNPDPKELVGQIDPPPIVQGMVLETRKGGRNGAELVSISLGGDMGLSKGNELYVYRADGKGKYLGKIRLDMVDYRTAVGVVIQSTKNGEIHRGDNVTTKL